MRSLMFIFFPFAHCLVLLFHLLMTGLSFCFICSLACHFISLICSPPCPFISLAVDWLVVLFHSLIGSFYFASSLACLDFFYVSVLFAKLGVAMRHKINALSSAHFSHFRSTRHKLMPVTDIHQREL